MSSKICKICKVSKLIAEYNKSSPNTSERRKTNCKTCQIIINKAHYEYRKDKKEKCDCGATFNNSNKYEHKKTAKHLKYIINACHYYKTKI